MIVSEGSAEAGVNLTEQPPFESVQVSLENLPGLSLDQATAPVGAEPGPWTFALQVVAEPTTTEAWLQDTMRARRGLS